MFADVLDAELGCTNVPPGGGGSGSGHRVLTAPLFVLEMPFPAARDAGGGLRSALPAAGLRVMGRVGAPARPASPTHPQDPPPPRHTPPPVPAIRLTRLEARAVEALNRMGAGLDDRVSLDTLRRAFRRLARRYHPDRHPGTSAVEQDRLARLFAEATDHYRLLAAALESRVPPR